MRFDPRVLKLEFAVTALLMATLIAFSSSAHAEPVKAIPLAQDNLRPLIKGVPRLNMSWSETKKTRKMNFSQLRSKLRPADEFAALYALQIALSRIGDGQTYVWGRPKRQLRALITPINSYRNETGSICREIIVSMVLGSYLKRIETTACRAKDHSWQLQS
jgi:hypothetical protein